MIEIQQLTKVYGDKTAVDDLTFAVRPGVVTGFLGPNEPPWVRRRVCGLRDLQVGVAVLARRW